MVDCEAEIINADNDDIQADSQSYSDDHPPKDALAHSQGGERFWSSRPEDESPSLEVKLNNVEGDQLYMIIFKVRQSYLLSIGCGTEEVSAYKSTSFKYIYIFLAHV